jgi:hypothetical protein
MVVSVLFYKSTNPKKKYDAVFRYDDGRQKSIAFGAKGYKDYTMPDTTEEEKKAYLRRHAKRENWNKYDTAGSLSANILWNKKDLIESMKDYKQRFKLN